MRPCNKTSHDAFSVLHISIVAHIRNKQIGAKGSHPFQCATTCHDAFVGTRITTSNVFYGADVQTSALNAPDLILEQPIWGSARRAAAPTASIDIRGSARTAAMTTATSVRSCNTMQRSLMSGHRTYCCTHTHIPGVTISYMYTPNKDVQPTRALKVALCIRGR